MKFDFIKVLGEMADAAAESLKEDLGTVPPYAVEVFNNEKAALRLLSDALISAEIDMEIFNKELRREKKVLETEMLTIQIMTKAAAQKAVNAAVKVLTETLKSIIIKV